MIEPKTIKPFRRFCMTIGELPTSYMESMTYYEMLSWLCNYLQNTVVPAVDNNAEAVTELQNYVANYFDNLDIQSEIDNKLDEMAESGELADIIAEYVQLQGVLAYNTLADLKSAENLTDGSFTRTFGTEELNDGYSYFYKIRQITSGDVVDEDNIVALTNYPTLIAEKIINQQEIDNTTDIETINSTIDDIIETYLPSKLDTSKVKNEHSTTAGDVYDVRYINTFNTVTLWVNSSPTNDFAGQQVSLDDDVSNYKYYEIIFKRSKNSSNYESTGEVDIEHLTTLQMVSNYIYLRGVSAVSGRNLTFGNAYYYATYGNSAETTSNDMVIPYKIIGHRH